MAKVIKTTYRKVIRRKFAPKRGKRANAKPSKVFAKKVRAVMRKDIESKQAFNSITATAFNSGVTTNTDVQVLLPSIAQGTTDNSRIGDQIKAQSLSVKGAIVYNPSVLQYGTYSNARLAVRVMVVQPRYLADYTSIQNAFSTWSSGLLKKGGTTTAFTGVLSDLWAPINSDLMIKYYDKVYYLNGVHQNSTVGSVQLLGSTKFFNINMKLRNKLLKYDSAVNGSLTPTNYAPIMLIGYAHMDGSAPDTTSTAIQVSYDANFTYEDA